MNKANIIKAAQDAILESDEERAMEIINEALALNLDLVEILKLGFCQGNRELCELFHRGEISLPELIFSTEIMRKVTDKIENSLEIKGINKNGKMVIATVEGDIHDIGKGIVVATLKAQGIEVIDLGREVPVHTIIEKAEEYQADIIATSAILTTTLMEQKKLEDTLRQFKLREKYKTMIGGAPCTQRWAEKIGADVYSEDAAEALEKALKLLGK